jgi:hemerythrin-like metal-binding protein
MEKIEWTSDIATGIKEIDEQHKVFIKLCAALVGCADGCLESTKIIGNVKKLEKIAEEHFSTEGRLMARSYYTDKKGHYRLHAHFLDELRKVKSRAEAGETGHEFAAEIKERLADWFIIHIKKNDMKMAGYLKSKE